MGIPRHKPNKKRLSVEEDCLAQCVLMGFVWEQKQVVALCELVRGVKKESV